MSALELDIEEFKRSNEDKEAGVMLKCGDTNDGYAFEIFTLGVRPVKHLPRWAFIITDKLDGMPIAAGVRDSYVEACKAVNRALELDRLECLPT